jgi:hypothetical protein
MTKRSPSSKTTKPEVPAAPAKRRGAGRPSTYDPAVGNEICERMAIGESLRSICRGVGMPDPNTVRLWAVKNHDGFGDRYARARSLQADAWVARAYDLAMDTPTDAGSVAKARLIIDTAKWTASHLMPGRYGDKVTAHLTGAGGGLLQIETSAFGAIAPHLNAAELAFVRQMVRRRIEEDDAAAKAAQGREDQS